MSNTVFIINNDDPIVLRNPRFVVMPGVVRLDELLEYFDCEIKTIRNELARQIQEQIGITTSANSEDSENSPYGLCLTCYEELGPVDDDPNGEHNPDCARCRAESEHDFDVEPEAQFDRSGNRIDV